MESKHKTAGPRLPARGSKKLSISRPSEKKISPLGLKLAALRRKIEQSGLPLLSDEEIINEVAARRGGIYVH